MTAFSDETGELLAETKRIIACGVTDFPVYQAIALLEKFEAALSASPVETWKCAARKQSLPEPADCGWPTCGCDPYADKVIAALEEQGHASPVDQEPVAKMTFTRAMDIAERGFKTWRSKPHNAKWFKRIDGTPIPNDLLVNIAEAFCNDET